MVDIISDVGIDTLFIIGSCIFFVVVLAVTFLKKPKRKVLLEDEIDIEDSIWTFAGEGDSVGYNSYGDKAVYDATTNTLKQVILKDGTVLPHVSINDVRFAITWDIITRKKPVLVMCRIDKTGVKRPWALPEDLKRKIKPSKLYEERIKRKVRKELLEGLRLKEKVEGSRFMEEPLYGKERWTQE
ncbi:MAG: hypothetical protein ACTSYD_02115 [Candidatus Heimdallarchaeaceae archaeon]